MLYKKKSRISGNGLFTDSNLYKGTLIGTFKTVPAIYSTKFSILSKSGWRRAVCILKYSNHSSKPNAWVDDDLNMWALKRIKPGEEITWDYGTGWGRDAK